MTDVSVLQLDTGECIYDSATSLVINSYYNDYMNIILCMLYVSISLVVFRASMHILHTLLRIFGYPDKDRLLKGQSTKSWVILSTVVTVYMIVHSLLKHSIYIGDVECMVIESHDIKESLIPLSVISGYFIYDILYHKLTREQIFHHILGILPILMVFVSNNSAIYYTEVLLITEVSTIFLNMMYLCTKTKNRKIFFTICFISSFFAVRVMFIFILLTKMASCFRLCLSHVIIASAISSLYILNLYWFYMVVLKFINLILRQGKKGVQPSVVKNLN